MCACPALTGSRFKNACPTFEIALPIVMLTGHGDVTLAVRAIKAGAIEFLEKPFERSALLGAIDEGFRHAARGEREHLASIDATTRLAALTVRERDVLDGMVLGRPNKLIAFDLEIAPPAQSKSTEQISWKSCTPGACPTFLNCVRSGLGRTRLTIAPLVYYVQTATCFHAIP